MAQTYHFKSKLVLQEEQTIIELLMPVSDFILNPTLKSTQRYFCGMHGMFKQGCKEGEKKDGSCTWGGGGVGTIKLLPVPNCLIM